MSFGEVLFPDPQSLKYPCSLILIHSFCNLQVSAMEAEEKCMIDVCKELEDDRKKSHEVLVHKMSARVWVRV